MSRAFFTLIPLRRYWNWQKKPLVFFDVSILGRFFWCVFIPNRDDRVSPARLSVIPGQLLCAGCGLGEQWFPNLSFWIAFPFNPLQTYVNSSLSLLVLGPEAGRPFFSNLESLQILTEISHIFFITFANSWPQGLPAHFPQSGAPPNPYWNITHSLYDIC